MSDLELLSRIQQLIEGSGGIVAGRLYSAREVAERWGTSTDTVYAIPEAELPRVRYGAQRGGVRFRGIDILRYEAGMEPMRHDDYLSTYSPTRSGRITPISKTKTRVL